MQVIETPPKYHLTTERLLSETAEPASLEALTADIREHLGELRLSSMRAHLLFACRSDACCESWRLFPCGRAAFLPASLALARNPVPSSPQTCYSPAGVPVDRETCLTKDVRRLHKSMCYTVLS